MPSVRAAVEAGIRVIPIPGASAVLPALVASGLPADRFVFEGFLPVKKGRATRLKLLHDETRTIVLYEAPHRVERTLQDLLDALGDKPPKGEMVIVVQGTGARTSSRDSRHGEIDSSTSETA